MPKTDLITQLCVCDVWGAGPHWCCCALAATRAIPRLEGFCPTELPPHPLRGFSFLPSAEPRSLDVEGTSFAQLARGDASFPPIWTKEERDP